MASVLCRIVFDGAVDIYVTVEPAAHRDSKTYVNHAESIAYQLLLCFKLHFMKQGILPVETYRMYVATLIKI